MSKSKIAKVNSDEELALKVGTALVKLLGLEVSQDGKYYTNNGDKARIGLARAVVSVILELVE